MDQLKKIKSEVLDTNDRSTPTEDQNENIKEIEHVVIKCEKDDFYMDEKNDAELIEEDPISFNMNLQDSCLKMKQENHQDVNVRVNEEKEDEYFAASSNDASVNVMLDEKAEKNQYKNPRGKPILKEQKILIFDYYRKLVSLGTKSKRQCVLMTAEKLGIGRCSVYRIVKEIEIEGIIKSPEYKRKRTTVFEKLNEDQKNRIRQVVQDFFERNELPTMDKIFQAIADDEILPPIGRTSLWKIIKKLDFVVGKLDMQSTSSSDSTTTDEWRNQNTDSNRLSTSKKHDEELFSEYQSSDYTSKQIGNLEKPKRIYNCEKRHVCNVCQKKFQRFSDYNKHQRVHSGERPFECDVCKKKFTEFGNLNKHKRIHRGEKPYSCDICQMTFTSNSYLTIHKRIHNDEKPYTCDICQKQFRATQHLTKHKRIHTGQKTYPCDICERTFNQNRSLIKHRRLHTEEMPYPCNICKKTFKLSQDLRRHKRLHRTTETLNNKIENGMFYTNDRNLGKNLYGCNEQVEHVVIKCEIDEEILQGDSCFSDDSLEDSLEMNQEPDYDIDMHFMMKSEEDEHLAVNQNAQFL